MGTAQEGAWPWRCRLLPGGPPSDPLGPPLSQVLRCGPVLWLNFTQMGSDAVNPEPRTQRCRPSTSAQQPVRCWRALGGRQPRLLAACRWALGSVVRVLGCGGQCCCERPHPAGQGRLGVIQQTRGAALVHSWGSLPRAGPTTLQPRSQGGHGVGAGVGESERSRLVACRGRAEAGLGTGAGPGGQEWSPRRGGALEKLPQAPGAQE